MTEVDRQEIAQALRADAPVVLAAGAGQRYDRIPPPPDEEWALPNGIAWVHYGEGNRGLTRPVIMADGFNTGPSTPEFSWGVLEYGTYPLISELRRRGRDVVLLGFSERSASIFDNAEAAKAAVHRAIAERMGGHPLAVGGFSMGGLVTRYALARMEYDGVDHQTALYWSYDSPHRGAWIPLSLQAFAHYTRDLDPRFSDQINSPASRQLLWQHLADWQDAPGTDKQRTEFLTELARVGGWPRRPQLIGVANGPATGAGNGIQPGQTAVRGKGLAITGTDLRTQPRAASALSALSAGSAGSAGDSLVATLRVITLQRPQIHAPGLPAVEGAPGGTLDGFGILADEFNRLGLLGLGVENPIRSHCFVPAVSAVAIRDIASDEDLYVDIDGLPPEESELDDFMLASDNEEHTKITEELCSWIMDRLP